MTIDLIKSLNLNILRYPGGDLAEKFDWTKSIGPMKNHGYCLDYGNNKQKVVFGLDDFLRLCENLNIKPLITIGFSNNSIESIKQLVEYCNGDTTTKWGKKRASYGHYKPYNVKYWEIGNSIYWKGMSIDKAIAYSNAADKISQALKKNYPDIETGTVLNGHNDTWDNAVMKYCGNDMNFFIVHEYYPNAYVQDTTKLDDIMIISTKIMKANLNRLEKLALSVNDKIKFAVTEYNTYLLNKKGAYINQKPNIIQGLYIAECLRVFLEDPNILLANKWDLSSYSQQNFADISFNRYDSTMLAPSYYIQKSIYGANMNYLLATKYFSPIVSLTNYDGKMKISDSNVVSAFSGISSNDKEVYIFIINRSNRNFNNPEINIINMTGNISLSVIATTGENVKQNVKAYIEANKDHGYRINMDILPHSFTTCKIVKN